MRGLTIYHPSAPEDTSPSLIPLCCYCSCEGGVITFFSVFLKVSICANTQCSVFISVHKLSVYALLWYSCISRFFCMILLCSMFWSIFNRDGGCCCGAVLIFLFVPLSLLLLIHSFYLVWQVLCIRYELKQHPKNNTIKQRLFACSNCNTK